MRHLLLLLGCVASTFVLAQTPSALDGTEFHGTARTEHVEGCEGCGNAGQVRFLPGSKVDYLLPGSDMVDRRSYTRDGDRLTLEGVGITMQVKGDSLFLFAFDQRYVYLRGRQQR